MSSDFNEFVSEQHGPARLSDVLARGVPIRWDEAVALLQEIIDTVTAGGESVLIPAFEDVLLDDEGAVRVNVTRRGERGPVAAGRALHALLATADVPIPLRLFVTQANVPETHSSLQSFADGLAYFGRSGRAELIRAVYARYRTSAAVSPSAPRPAPARHATPADQVPQSRRKRPRWVIRAAVVLAIVGFAGVIWFGIPGGASGNGTVLTQVKAAIEAAAPTITQALAPPTGKTVPPDTTAGEQGVPTPTARAQTRAPIERRAVAGEDTRDSSRPLSFEAVSVPSLPSPSPKAASAESSNPVIPVMREYVVAPRESEATAIYSSDDVDVQPPVMMYPSLPPPVFVARNADAVVVNRMELLVAADGSVERVRLVNGPTRMPDMMLLSGAKLWKFSPAVKNGVPVRYRTTVTWTGFP